VSGGNHPRPYKPKEVTVALPSYAVPFRGRYACPCQVLWIPAYEHEAQRRGILPSGGTLTIYQLIGGYAASGGTHADGGAGDYLDLPGEEDLWLMRQMGADASWLRLAGWDNGGGITHVHSVLTGCPHNGPAAYQIDAVKAGFNGLGRGGPRPLSGRTWQQGIEWARAQEKEQDMLDEKRVREIVREEVGNYRVDVGGKAKVKLPAALQRLFERTSRK
jgi:hypothetical protein